MYVRVREREREIRSVVLLNKPMVHFGEGTFRKFSKHQKKIV